MQKNDFKRMVSEELRGMLKEAAEKAPDYTQKLEELRKKLVPSVIKSMQEKVETTNDVGVRRVAINTVSEILDIPVNELMLHFLNNVKNQNIGVGKQMVEYHQGQVHFFADAE